MTWSKSQAKERFAVWKATLTLTQTIPTRWNLVRILVIVFVSSFHSVVVLSQPAESAKSSHVIGAARLSAEGKQLAAQGLFAQAEIPLENAAKLTPRNAELLELLAKVKVKIGKLNEALPLFQNIVQLKPSNGAARVNFAIALADSNDLQGALRELDTALAIAPNLPAAHINRARVLADLHRNQESGREFERACRLAPQDADCFLYWGLLEQELGHAAEESMRFHEVLKLQPGNTKAWLLYAKSLKEQSRDAECMAALRELLRLEPDSQEATYMLSVELRKTDPEASRRLLEKFEAGRQRFADVEQSKTLGNDAFLAAGRRDWPEAIKLLRRAIPLCGDCDAAAQLHKNLGLALSQNGDISEGRQELQESLKLNPADPDVVKALAVLDQAIPQ